MKNKMLYRVVLLVIALSFIQASSASVCFSYTSSIVASLSITDGSARAAGLIVPMGNQRTSVSVSLQRKQGTGSWITIRSWSGSNNNGESEAGGTYGALSGYSYRTYVVGKVYDSSGNTLETVTKYSAVKDY